MLAGRVASRFQVELLEFLRCRAEVAEVVNGRANRREGERLERFLEHLVEVSPRGEAGGDVRMVILAGMLRHELRNVGDQLREDFGTSPVTNAAEVPVSTTNGVTASITCFSSASNSGVGLMTMPERPRSLT